jgi:hypothetical protein
MKNYAINIKNGQNLIKKLYSGQGPTQIKA